MSEDFGAMTIRTIINKIRGVMDVPSLVKKGLMIGENVFINFGCIIDESFCWLIKIGNNVTLAPNVHILAHDASTKKMIGYTKMGMVTIGNDVFIGASSIILPGRNIGNNVVIGAGSIVSKDIPDNSVAVGNPAKVICSYDEYIEKQKAKLCLTDTFPYAPDKKEQERIKKFLKENKIGFID